MGPLGILLDDILKNNRYSYPGGAMKYSRMVSGILAKYDTLALLGSDTKMNQGLNLSLTDSQVLSLTAFIYTT